MALSKPLPPETTPSGFAEKLVRRDTAIAFAGLVGLCLLSWLWVFRGAGMGMSAWEMTRLGLFPHLAARPDGMGMSQPPAAGGAAGTFLLITSMWWIMMIAMMLPSAAPMILLYARNARFQQHRGRMTAGPVASGAFLAGYLIVWLGFSMAAALLQMALTSTETLSSMMLWSQSRWLSAGLLAVAAAYQITPIKAACLEHCQSPAQWLSRNWRHGASGAWRMGLIHGGYCLGCCWALMLMLFVGGVMNLVWIAALAALVMAEKLVFRGATGGAVSAALLGLWACATLIV